MKIKNAWRSTLTSRLKPINDPLDDFEVVPHRPTAEEDRMMSERICQENAERTKNPSNIDFFINSGNPSEEDFKKISGLIRTLKAKNIKSDKSKIRIHEPLDVDFEVINRQSTPEEDRMMKEYIKKDKEKRAKALAKKQAGKTPRKAKTV